MEACGSFLIWLFVNWWLLCVVDVNRLVILCSCYRWCIFVSRLVRYLLWWIDHPFAHLRSWQIWWIEWCTDATPMWMGMCLRWAKCWFSLCWNYGLQYLSDPCILALPILFWPNIFNNWAFCRPKFSIIRKNLYSTLQYY